MSTNHRRKPYMPDSDSGKKQWMKRFIEQIESDPARYGFTDPRMFEYYQRTIRTFITAMDAVQNPATCTPGAVMEKNRARKEAVALCRGFAMQFKWDSSLTREEKTTLGIHIDDAPAEKAKLPAGLLPGSLGFPLLTVQSSPNGGHVIRFSDPMSTSKAKPKGVSHLLLFGAIGEKPNMPHSRAQFLNPYTKRPFEIMFPMQCGLEGLYVTYYGRWLTMRGEMSPWSRGVSKIIGETQVSLRDCEFAHLFGKEGFIDELPEGMERDRVLIDETRPLLEGIAGEHSIAGGLFATLEAKMLEAATMRPRLLDAA